MDRLGEVNTYVHIPYVYLLQWRSGDLHVLPFLSLSFLLLALHTSHARVSILEIAIEVGSQHRQTGELQPKPPA